MEAHKLTKAQFAKRCGVSNGYIVSYIQRGKLTLDADQLLDINDPRNAAFYERNIRKGRAPIGDENPFDKLFQELDSYKFSRADDQTVSSFMKKSGLRVIPLTLAQNIAAGHLVDLCENLCEELAAQFGTKNAAIQYFLSKAATAKRMCEVLAELAGDIAEAEIDIAKTKKRGEPNGK